MIRGAVLFMRPKNVVENLREKEENQIKKNTKFFLSSEFHVQTETFFLCLNFTFD